MAALRGVGSEGRVDFYEIVGEILDDARPAIVDTLGGSLSALELTMGDVGRDLAERYVDRLLLDLPEPWEAVTAAAASLRAGGILFAHCPNVSQVQRLMDALREQGGFGLLETVELLERGWTVRGRSLRPSHRMVAHTGFLTFAHRLAGGETFETGSGGVRARAAELAGTNT